MNENMLLEQTLEIAETDYYSAYKFLQNNMNQLPKGDYPLKIQFNTYFDRQFNDWMHDKFYKRKFDNKIGQKLRKEYEDGKIKSRQEFEEVLKNVLSNCKKV